MLWTNKSKFEVFGSQRHIREMQKKKKILEECLTPSVKHGVMIWGCFGGGKSGRFVQGKRDLEEGRLSLHFATPCHTLWKVLNWSDPKHNDPKHSSKLCINNLGKKQSASILSIMEWPAQSPDLNPIELLWEQLDRMVCKRGPSSQSNL